MKGRGVRTISPTQLRQVTPDAEEKTRFVLVDAVGVTESLKHVSQPLERNRVISFDRLLDDIAAGRRDDDALSTLAGRLAALDRKIDDKDRAAIGKATGGFNPRALAHKLLDAVDPDTIEREAVARHGPMASDRERDAVGKALKEEICRVFDDPALRQLLKDVKRATEIRIDTISTDTVVSSGYDEARAQDTTGRFRRFLHEHQDKLVALQILVSSAPRRSSARPRRYRGIARCKCAVPPGCWSRSTSGARTSGSTTNASGAIPSVACQTSRPSASGGSLMPT
jgi:type I restriction enzyme R subunit